MKEKEVVNYDELVRILNNTDSSNKIIAPVLEELLGYSEKKSNHNRIIRTAIKKLTDLGVVIGSSNRGYFKIKTPEELRKYVQMLDHNILGHKARKRSVISAWKKAHPYKHILKIKKE
jgi:hypothetical protein